MFFIINLRWLNLKKYIVTLAKEERETLDTLISKGKHQSQKILNALILLGCDEGAYQMKRSTNEIMASAEILLMMHGRYTMGEIAGGGGF